MYIYKGPSIQLHECSLFPAPLPNPYPLELWVLPEHRVTNTHTHCTAIPEHTLCMPNRPYENSIERAVHRRETERGKQWNSVFHAPACSCTLCCFDGVNECLKANSRLLSWAHCASVHTVPVRAVTLIYYCSDVKLVIAFPCPPATLAPSPISCMLYYRKVPSFHLNRLIGTAMCMINTVFFFLFFSHVLVLLTFLCLVDTVIYIFIFKLAFFFFFSTA